MGWLIKSALGAIWSVLGSLFGVKQAEILGKAQVGTALAHSIGVEAKAREETHQAYVSAGWFWMSIPFLMIAGASATYYVLIVADTIFAFSWNIEKLPSPFDSTINQIILVTGGVSGGISALGLLFGRR